jgi:hypothetical protein
MLRTESAAEVARARTSFIAFLARTIGRSPIFAPVAYPPAKAARVKKNPICQHLHLSSPKAYPLEAIATASRAFGSG